MFTLKIKTSAVVKPNRFEFQVLKKGIFKIISQANVTLVHYTHTPKQTGAGSSFGALQVVNKHLLQAACWQQICYWHVYLFIYLSILLQDLVSHCGRKEEGGKNVNCPWTVVGVQGNSVVAFQSKPLHHCFFIFSFGADAVQGLLWGGTQGAMFSEGDKRQRICKESSMGSSFCIEHTHKKKMILFEIKQNFDLTIFTHVATFNVWIKKKTYLQGHG